MDDRRKIRLLRHSDGVLLIRDEDFERLQREAAAAKGLIDSVRNIVHFANNDHNSAPNWATIRLEDALAHYIRAVQRGDQ